MSDPIIADYIIVGAGSAGCVLANRLSADPANKVLLLEAGGDDRPLHNLKQFWSNILIHTPIGFGKTLNDPKVNWIYETEPDRRHGRAAAQMAEGQGARRLLLDQRPCSTFAARRPIMTAGRRWAARAGPMTTCSPISAARSIRSAASASSHGVGGPLEHLRLSRSATKSARLCSTPASRPASLIRPTSTRGDQEGVTWFQLTEKGGKRCSTAVGYPPSGDGPRRICASKPRRRPRASCSRARRAVGVEFVQGGETKVARANAEVILAAGAVASPQLLEVSGIGPAASCRGLGVPVVHESAGVGENLQDHYMIGCQWPVKPEYKTVNELSHGFQLAREIVKYAVAKKGLLTYAVAHIVAFTKTPPGARRIPTSSST